jgi:hypothetical protein
VIGQPATSARSLAGNSGILAVGLIVGMVTLVSMTALRPTLLYIVLAALCLAIPTLIVKNPKAYWLFLLVLTIPIDIQKHTTVWIIDPQTLYNQFGPPPSGLSLDIWVTDVVLFAMFLPWLARLCLQRDQLYFPNIGYLYLLYLIWALIVSSIEARSLYLSMFQWCREILYFLFFIYVINNVVTRPQFKAVILGLSGAIVISAGSVIIFFALGIGNETSAFSGLYSYVSDSTKSLTLYQTSSSLSIRSSGIFPHPALAACFFGMTLPIVLAQLIASRRLLDRVLYASLYATGFAASYLTFSRAGLVGLIVGSLVSFTLGRFSRLVPPNIFAVTAFVLGLAAVGATPLVISSIENRPESVSGRWVLVDIAIETYKDRPFVGQGLNNSSAVINERAKVVDQAGKTQFRGGIPSHYLVVLVEVGLIGFLIYFTFFTRVLFIALRSMRPADRDMKILVVGVIGGLASLATQNLADNALGGHSTNAVLWLHVGLIFAIARKVRAERKQPAPARGLQPAPQLPGLPQPS